MKSTTVRRVGLSIAVATALASVAACGSSGSSGSSGKDDKAVGKGSTRVSPIAALRSAEQSTDKADSAKVESSTVMGSLMSMDAKGNLGWGDGITGVLTMTYTGGTMAQTMRAAGSTSMEARYLPDAYYAKMGDKFAEQAGGKHWLKYDYDDLAKLGGSSGAYLKDQMQNSTPNQSVKLLLASGDVKKVGTEPVRGQQATHYSGTVNVADLAAKNSNLTASQLAGLKKQLTAAEGHHGTGRHLGQRPEPADQEGREGPDVLGPVQPDRLLQRLRREDRRDRAPGERHRGLHGAAEAAGRGLGQQRHVDRVRYEFLSGPQPP